MNKIRLRGLICSFKSVKNYRFLHFVCMYVLGCKLRLVRLCDSDFGITPVDDISTGITCAAFCFHMAHISFAGSWYLFCLSVIVLARLCVFGTAMSIKRCSLFSYS